MKQDTYKQQLKQTALFLNFRQSAFFCPIPYILHKQMIWFTLQFKSIQLISAHKRNNYTFDMKYYIQK